LKERRKRMSYRARRAWHRLGRLKLWQRLLLLALIVGLMVGLSVAYGRSGGDSTAAAGEESVQLVTVQSGDLTSTIYSSGSLVYSTSEQLTFDSAGTVEAVYVENDDTVEEGDVLARLDSESIESLDKAVAQARINLRDAEEALADAQNPYSESDIADAEEAVDQAQKELTDAQERGAIQIANAEYAVDEALEACSDGLAQYMSGLISFEEYDKVRRDWELEKLDLEMVKVNVEKSVSDAESKLASAEEALADVLEGADPLNVALKQAEVDSARAALDDALEQLESARDGYPVVAPFGGVVARVNVEPGDEVNANTVVVELVDPTGFEVSAIVDEIDVAQLRLGQEASVTLDAITDLELSGNVSSISAFARSQSGVVSYPITISVATPGDVQLLEGMSATATIEIELASDALLVPSSAVRETGDRAVIMVMVDRQPQPRMVTLGATDGVETEVLTGLQEGDEVIVELPTGGASPDDMPEDLEPPEGFKRPEGLGPGVGGGGGGFFPR
jgi:HlyD family secretion protein